MSDRPDIPARARAQARLADAARMLPFLCFGLLILPVILLPDGEPRATVRWLGWLFGAWAGVLILAFLISRRHQRQGEETQE